MIRCIQYSNENGLREGVYFTDDFETPSGEFIPYGCTLEDDFILNDEFPAGFPLNYNLEKTF